MILAAVVAYKAPENDHSVTEGMTQHDIDLTSRAQYTALQINKNSAFGRFGENKASLGKWKMPLVCLFLYNLDVQG